MTPAELRRIRWQHIALVPQSAMNGLDPVYTVESQLTEAITAHQRMPRRSAAAASPSCSRWSGWNRAGCGIIHTSSAAGCDSGR